MGKPKKYRPRCVAMTKKRKQCPLLADEGFDRCHVHRDRPDLDRKGRRIGGPETSACYRCTRYVLCYPTRLDDGTWAWLCADHRRDTAQPVSR